jgi:hypothetical protein
MNLNVRDVEMEGSTFSASDNGNGAVCSAPSCWVEDSPPDRRGVVSVAKATGDSGRGVLLGSAMMDSYTVSHQIVHMNTSCKFE